ncbi:hypothetical protein Tco_1043015 [Tanacetum coccineum]|uniref:Uncharacterized protein n=1 Tax=Tanacetum coccineum TaxID=301880 RepID=A0ABQ5GM29_9ASTR
MDVFSLESVSYKFWLSLVYLRRVIYLDVVINGPRKLLTARKRVGPLPATTDLASGHASLVSSDHHSFLLVFLDSLPVLTLGLGMHRSGFILDFRIKMDYSRCVTFEGSTSSLSLFLSEAFCCWCAAPLSTFYPPTTLESSSGDSSERPLHSSSHFARPSRKRCRSLVDFVPSSRQVMGSLAPTRADLLPPRKRFRDSYSSEASIEEDAEVGLIETGVDMELGIGDGDDVKDHVEIDHRDVRDDTEEYEADASARDTVEVGIDPMELDWLGSRCEVWFNGSASEDRARMAERIYSLRLENLKVHATLDIKRDRVNNLRLHISLSQEEFHQIRRDRNDARGRLEVELYALKE